MEEELFLNASSPNWEPSSAMDVKLSDLNCPTNHFPALLSVNWDNSIDQSVQFESAFSSLVSSPASATAAGTADSVSLKELIGRLGNISHSGEIIPQFFVGGTNSNNSGSASCYGTPLNSPRKLSVSAMDQQMRGNLPIPPTGHQNMPPFSADTGFVERAAKYSCFSNQNFAGFEFPYKSARSLESGKLSRVSSSLSSVSQVGAGENKETAPSDMPELDFTCGFGTERKFTKRSGPLAPDEAELNSTLEESSVSDQMFGKDDHNARKRKAPLKVKTKDKDTKVSEGHEAKRSNLLEDMGPEKAAIKSETEQSGIQKQNKDNPKPPEPPKDYIHVRARRGQATDSHSLAERVRREKISERMKFLQDLVPGCNKVTGKAVMLDEIINYVQSLQRQVEFLSMKLANVNPRLNFDVDSLLSKETRLSSQPQGDFSQIDCPLDLTSSSFSFAHDSIPEPMRGLAVDDSEIECSINPLDSSVGQTWAAQILDGFSDASRQLPCIWEDDLQSVVQMGTGLTRELVFPSQSFHGSTPTSHLKLEL